MAEELAPSGSDGIRRRDRRWRPVGPVGGDPVEAAYPRHGRLPGGKRRRGRRPYPVRRRAGAARAERTDPDWKEKGAPLDTPAREDRFLFLTETRSFQLPTPAADAQSRQLHRLARQRRPLARPAGRGIGRRDLSRFRRRGIAGGRRPHRRHRHRRYGRRQGRPADRKLPARHGIAGALHAVRRGLPRLAVQAVDAAFQSARRPRPADLRDRDQGTVGNPGRQPQARADRPQSGLAARTVDLRRVVPVSFRRQPGVLRRSSSGWTTATHGCRRSTRCSATRPTRRCARISRADGGFPMALGR